MGQPCRPPARSPQLGTEAGKGLPSSAELGVSASSGRKAGSGEGAQSRQQLPGPKARRGPPRTSGGSPYPEGPSPWSRPPPAKSELQLRLGAGELGCGAGLARGPESKDECAAKAAGSPLSPGTVSGRLSDSCLHPGPATAPWHRPHPLSQGRKPQGVRGRFLEPSRVPSTRVWTFLEEESLGGEGVFGKRVMDRLFGDRLQPLIGALKSEWGRHDPRTPVPPHLSTPPGSGQEVRT